MEKVCIVIPVYNVKQYICHCIDSVLRQTFKSFRMILIDDGSIDESGKMCDEYAYKDRKIVVFHQKNNGLSAARNKGIDWALECSNIQWISFIDSDDWVKNEYISHLYKAAINSNSDISSCSRMTIDMSGTEVSKNYILPNETITSFEALQKLANDKWSEYNSAWKKLYNVSLFNEIRFPIGKNYEDVYIMHELFNKANRITTISNLDYCYYLRQNSIMHSTIGIKNIYDIEAFCVRYNFYYKNNFINECHKIFDVLHYKYEYYLLKIIPKNFEERKLIKKVRKMFITIYIKECGRIPFKSWLRYNCPKYYRIYLSLKNKKH